MYIELIHFQRGVFLLKEKPFYSKNALPTYDHVVAKYAKLPGEVMIALRHDNHVLIKSWTNVLPLISGKEMIKAAKR